MEHMKQAIILVPTFNESATVGKLLDRVSVIRLELLELPQDSAIELQLMIIDDNSPDQTADLVEDMALPWVSILRRSEKMGLGPAYIAGFEKALAEKFEYIIEMDADLSHQPEALPRLLSPVISGQAQLTIGTRWMPGGKVVNWPLTRQLISRAGTGYARLALGIDLRDVTSGYRVFHRSVLESIDFKKIEAHGYGFQIEMVIKTLKNGFIIEEVPITFVEREGGVSKMSKRIVIEALWKVTIWGLQRFNKLR